MSDVLTLIERFDKAAQTWRIEQAGSTPQHTSRKLAAQEYTKAKAALADELARLSALVAKYEARLEIGHMYRLVEGEGVVIEEVPSAERGSIPDAVSCRDETIRLLDNNLASLERERDALREVLAQIANSNGPRAAEYRSIARAALEAKP